MSTHYTNHEFQLSDLVPEEFRDQKYRKQLEALLRAKANNNGLAGKDNKDLYGWDSPLEDNGLVVVNGTAEDAEAFAAAVRATNWK